MRVKFRFLFLLVLTEVSLSVYLCRPHVCNLPCHAIDEKNLLLLSASRCCLHFCDHDKAYCKLYLYHCAIEDYVVEKGIMYPTQSEAEFLHKIQTKVVFLLAIHSHLYSFALRFQFLQTHASSYVFLQTYTTSYSFCSSVILLYSTQ